MNYLAVFSCRSQCLNLQRICLSNGINTSVVNTPLYIRKGCSLSLEFDYEYIENISQFIRQNELDCFIGFYAL